ncbi:LysR family transcriptional regulator [Comamonas humi]
MRLEDLQSFALICDTGQLSRAASRLGSTQSALSKTVGRLEAEFGVPLLERTARGMVPTAAGAQLLAHTRQLTTVCNDIQASMAQQRAATSGLLRIGVLPVLTHALLSPLIASFLPTRPLARFRFESELSTRLVQRLEDGHLDLAFVALPDSIPPGMGHLPLGQLRISVVARQGHPRLAHFRQLADLAGEQWALPSRDMLLRRWLDARLAAHQLPEPVVIVESADTPSSFAALLQRSDLLGIASTAMLAQPAGQGLCALEGADFHWQHRLGVLWRQQAALPPLAQEFRDLAVAWCEGREF